MPSNARPLIVPGLLLCFFFLYADTAMSSTARGYQERACGLDMNRNGIIGEAAGADPLTDPGDCNVCDGGPFHPTHRATGTPDPDGDGVDEDLIYVDADFGNDVTGDGSALNPYRTLEFAWGTADGPADGAEDILCFRGTSTEWFLSPREGLQGLPETYVVPAAGSEERDWHYPAHPTMLVGWDRDDDGCYPPYDNGSRCGATADVAVLSGASASSTRAFHLLPDVSYFEMAHLTLEDYGRFGGDATGFIKFRAQSTHEYLYLHDLELRRINMQRSHESQVIAFDFFNTNVHWASFENLLFQANGGWLVRGSPHQGDNGEADAGPLKWQHITRVMRGPDNGSTDTFKVWGYISGVEVLDSIFDLNTAAWTPKPGSGNATIAFVIVQCNQDWLVRNNEIIDFWGGLRVNGTAPGACDNASARPTTDIVIDRNIFRNTYPQWDFGHFGISVTGDDTGTEEGDVANEVVGNVTISNNFISSTGSGRWESCVAANPGNDAAPPPGTITIVNNTCYGPMRRDEGAGILIGSTVDGAPQFQRFMQQRFRIENNIIDGLNANDHNVLLGYIPNQLVSDHNVFDPAGRYAIWSGGSLSGQATVAGWQGVAGTEAASIECYPTFVDEAGGDFHLTLDDTCAIGMGSNLSPLALRDIDGTPRVSDGPWDVGADDSLQLFMDGFESGTFAGWSLAIP